MTGTLLLLLAMGSMSCMRELKTVVRDDKPRQTEKRNLKGFEEIEISGSPTVYYTQADTFSVRVVGPEDGIGNIITEVDKGTLTIRNRGKMGVLNVTFNGDDDTEVYVTSPDLIGVRLSGSGDFISKRQIDTDNIDIVLRGSGDIDVKDLICDRCRVELIGSGDVRVERLEAKMASASLVGSGDMELEQWNVASTDLSLKGSGDMQVRFAQGCRKVDCELRGSGDMELSGQIGHLSKRKSGSGDIDTHKLTVQK